MFSLPQPFSGPPNDLFMSFPRDRQVKAEDKDWQDKHGLLYTLSGDGVDGFSPADAYFSIDSLTGELIQQRVSGGGDVIVMCGCDTILQR